MHPDQLEIRADAVQRLVAAQFPHWAHLAVRPVPGAGTVNAIFRLGDELAARFPLNGTHARTVRGQLEREATALTEFAAASPLPVPRAVAMGDPGEGYPLPWSVRTWLPGRTATPTGDADSPQLAGDLADLIAALRAQPTRGRRFAGGGRGGDLRRHIAWVERCFDESTTLLDIAPLRSLWDRLVDLPRHGPDVMSHGDLIPFNLLVSEARLTGVLDADGYAPADPALDLVAAWHHLDAPARAVLRSRLGSDDLEWARGAAWAFVQAIGLVWYYVDSHPPMAALGRSTLTRLVDADADLP